MRFLSLVHVLALSFLVLIPTTSWADNSSTDEPPPTETKETDAAKEVRLKREQEAIMAELLALEEGYSDLKGREGEDAASEEARLLARLTKLQTRFDVIEHELKVLTEKKKKK